MALPRAQQQAYLDAMGVQVWHARAASAAGEAAQPVAVQGPGPADTVAMLDWAALQQAVATCSRCGLQETRIQTVFGVGDPQADWLIVGEAPGADEDRAGEPFVGRAGQLLNAMLKAIGHERRQVYIANILKCRPPNNRDPHADEVTCCEPYLQRQVDLIAPRVILAVGRIAAQNLLHSNLPIGKLRGQVHYYGEQRIPLIATYHPAYLLRSPGEKRRAWQDLQLAVRTYQAVLGELR
jgi:DNA polymerase